MKAILITVALAASSVTFAVNAREIKPYSPKANTYEVDGKTMSAAEATIAYLAGKSVKKCTAMSGVQAEKTYRIAGKTVKGSELTSCVDQELVGKASGTGFAKKK